MTRGRVHNPTRRARPGEWKGLSAEALSRQRKSAAPKAKPPVVAAESPSEAPSKDAPRARTKPAPRPRAAKPPPKPVVEQKKTDYSATPLPVKLGLSGRILVTGEPRSPALDAYVGEPSGPFDVAVFFVLSSSALREKFGQLRRRMEPSSALWVAWPKKVSGLKTDLSFELIQQTGLHAGLVDNKSCGIDAAWQALRFVHRRKDR